MTHLPVGGEKHTDPFVHGDVSDKYHRSGLAIKTLKSRGINQDVVGNESGITS